MRYIGLFLDSKCHLDYHVEKAGKAYRTGFETRSAMKIKKPTTYLYFSKTLIRTQHECAYSSWNSHYNKYEEK